MSQFMMNSGNWQSSWDLEVSDGTLSVTPSGPFLS